MGDGNWKSYRSTVDRTQSIFVTNFPDHITARDLWKVCNDYEVIMDAFIPYKKSKAGLWVLIEMVSISAKEKLLNHTGVGSCESSDDEEDTKDDASQSEDKVTTDNDVARVSESSCMHTNDLLYDNNHNNIMPNKDKALFDDPFNLYDILNKIKDSGEDLKYLPSFTPSVINMEEVNKKVKGATSNSGGILCFWEPTWFVKDNVTSSDNFFVVMGTWVLSSSKLLIKSVFSPQDLTEKRVLWDYILYLIIMRDFNKVRTKQERYGSVFNVEGANIFKSSISLAKLINLPLDGYAYTWAHKTVNKMIKLDRFLVSKGLLASFPYLLALCLDRNLSDHYPILMRELRIDYGPTPFRFFHSCFNLDGFDKMVEDR
nr:RNA-directed DNA polymerase, eukaryota [Tanacetum cinerariifolium]